MHPLALLRRLLLAVPTLLGVAVVVFVLMRVVPGDPIAMMIPPGASSEDVARLRAFYGLDKGIAAQFLIWLKEASQGHFGTSIVFKQDVMSLIGDKLAATLELGSAAMLIAVVLGGVAGIASAARHGRWLACCCPCCRFRGDSIRRSANRRAPASCCSRRWCTFAGKFWDRCCRTCSRRHWRWPCRWRR